MAYPNDDHPRLTEQEARDALEWGSCDDCGRHSYCPVCGGRPEVGHEEGCPVPRMVKFHGK